MSRSKEGLITISILLGLSVFLCSSPLAAQLTGSTEDGSGAGGSAERVFEPISGVRADLSADGRSVTISWNLSPNDQLRSVPAGSNFTSEGNFLNFNDVAGYNVWRSASGGSEPALLGTVPSGQTSFVDNSLTLGATYTFSVTTISTISGEESIPAEASPQIDFTLPTVTLSVDPNSVAEDDGVVNSVVTATLSKSWSLATPIQLSLSGTAENVDGRDYVGELGDQEVVIPAGGTEGRTILTLNINDDNIVEGDDPETIVIVGSSSATGGATVDAQDLEVSTAEVALTDNDITPTSISLSVDPSNVGEGEGGVSVNVTGLLGDGSTVLLVDTEVVVSLSGTHVEFGPDYEASELTITIPAEQAEGSGTIALTLIEDNLAEGEETIEVSGVSPGFIVESAMVGLSDNDVAPTSVTLSVDASSFDEGRGGEVTVTAVLGDGSTALLTDTQVALSVAESEDNAATVATLTIPATETTGSATLPISLVDDNLVEGDETITLEGNADGLEIASVELTVIDNDVMPTTISLSVDASSFDEGRGGEVTVTAVLGDGSTALLTDTQVALSVAESEDNAGAEATLTIPARETTGSVSLPLSLVDDNLVEGDEAIALEGSAGGFEIASVELTVTDNDVMPTTISLGVDASSFDEGTGGEVTVTAVLGDGSAALLVDTQVALSVAESEDNAGAEATLTIPARETTGSVSLPLSLVDDNLVEGDEAIALEGSAGGFEIASVELTVTDNDVMPTTISLSLDPNSFEEGPGGQVVVTAVLGDGSAALLVDTQVALSVAESEDNAGAEATLTIPATETTGSATLPFFLVDDNLVEGDETIALEGSAEGFEIASVELTVTDNDVMPTTISLSVDVSSFDEGTGGEATVTAVLGDGSTALLTDTQVALSVTESEDNAAAEATLTIPARETAGSATIPISLVDDNLVEGDETIVLEGSAEGYDIASVELTVTDNDVMPTTISLSVDVSSFDEGTGGEATVTAVLGDGSTALLTDIQVALSVAESEDNAATAATLTIAARGTTGSATIPISLVDDNLVEGDETIVLEGSAEGYGIASVELTVTDNDVMPTTISLSVDVSSFDEGTGGEATVSAVLGDGSTALLTDTQVALSVAESEDNAATAATLTIAARGTTGSATIPISLVDDNLAEGDEIIVLEGSAEGFEIASVELTVTDNDVAPTSITLSVDVPSFDEGDGETSFEVTAVLGDGSTALLTDTQVSLSLSGTAEEGTDYAASIPTITVGARTTESSGTLTLTPPEELIPEYDETIVVEGSAEGFTVESVTITLTDNDDEPTRVDPIPVMMLYVGGADGVEDVSDNFRGLDLNYSATSSNPGVATVSVAGSEVTVAAVIEGESTIEVVAMNTIGPDASQTFVVTVVTEPAEVAIVGDALAAIGRSTLSSVSSAIGARFASSSGSNKATLAGLSLLSGSDRDPLASQVTGLEGDFRYPRGLGTLGGGISWKQAIRNTSFAVPVGSSDADQGLPNWTLWGLGDYQAFEGTPDHGSHDGTLMTVYLGADKRVAATGQAGVSVSYSMGEANYTFSGDGAIGGGTLTTVLTSVYPYVRWAPSAGMDIWALGGVGVGTAENERGVTSTTEESDLSMSLGLLGARQSLGSMGGLDMSLRGDVGIVNLSTAEGEEVLDDQAVAGQRFRLGVEGARTVVLASCATITPFGELGGRYDGGDGQTGGGLEVAGGLRYQCPRSRFQIEARGRMLALNSTYQESGGSIIASLSPGRDGLGLSMSLAPRWGAADRGTHALWRDGALQTGRFGLSPDVWSMDALVGYSMRVEPLHGVLTPFAEFGPVSSERSLMRLGFQLGRFTGTAFEMLDLNVSAGRGNRVQQSAEHRIDVRGAVRF